MKIWRSFSLNFIYPVVADMKRRQIFCIIHTIHSWMEYSHDFHTATVCFLLNVRRNKKHNEKRKWNVVRPKINDLSTRKTANNFHLCVCMCVCVCILFTFAWIYETRTHSVANGTDDIWWCSLYDTLIDRETNYWRLTTTTTTISKQSVLWKFIYFFNFNRHSVLFVNNKKLYKQVSNNLWIEREREEFLFH